MKKKKKYEVKIVEKKEGQEKSLYVMVAFMKENYLLPDPIYKRNIVVN